MRVKGSEVLASMTSQQRSLYYLRDPPLGTPQEEEAPGPGESWSFPPTTVDP